MDEQHEDKTTTRDERTLARLLRLAAPRPEVPADAEARVYERVEAEWRAATSSPADRVYPNVERAWARGGRRHRMRWAVPAALAATVVLAVVLWRTPTPTRPVVSPVGEVVRVVRATTASPGTGEAVMPGDRFVTAAGEGLGLMLDGRVSLRIDEYTRLEIASEDRIRLIEGRIYADTGDLIYRDSHIVIETDFGDVVDVGTQFAVSTDQAALEVAVREGRVDVDAITDAHVAVAGELMRIDRAGDVSRGEIAPHDAAWRWATGLAPAFDIEGRSMLDFLRWVARETGRELVFDDPATRMAAMRTDLHGSVEGFGPDEALASIAAGTRFLVRIETDRIVVTQ